MLAEISAVRSLAESDRVFGSAATIRSSDVPSPPATAAADTAPCAASADDRAAKNSRIEASLDSRGWVMVDTSTVQRSAVRRRPTADAASVSIIDRPLFTIMWSSTPSVGKTLIAAPDLDAEWRRLARVKEVIGGLTLQPLPEELWDRYWASVYTRLERGPGVDTRIRRHHRAHRVRRLASGDRFFC